MILRSVEGVTSFNNGHCANFSSENGNWMKLSGEHIYIF